MLIPLSFSNSFVSIQDPVQHPVWVHTAHVCIIQHMHTQMHMDIHGSSPQLPLPPQKISRPNSYYKRSYSILCVLMQKPIYIWWKVNTKYMMVTPYLPMSLKNFQYPNHIIRHDMAYYSDRFGSPISGTPSSWGGQHMQMHMDIHGGSSQLPLPPQKISRPNSYYEQSYSILCVLMQKPIYIWWKVNTKYMVVTPHLPTSLKNFQYSKHITRHDMAYYSDGFGSPISEPRLHGGGPNQSPRWVHLKNLYVEMKESGLLGGAT